MFVLNKDYSNRVDNKIDSVHVLVANQDIAKGSEITHNMIEVKNIKEEELTDSDITNIHDVVGGTATTNIKKGDRFSYSNIK